MKLTVSLVCLERRDLFCCRGEHFGCRVGLVVVMARGHLAAYWGRGALLVDV